MQLRTLLEIRHGLTAIIGGGGKTTLLYALAKECSMDARVIVCTTTHILKPSHLPCVLSGGEAEIQAALEENSCVCVGTKSETGKFGAPAISFERLLQLADYVFVEADGSKHLPLKAHAGHEPVVPKETNQTILVLGVSGLGRPIREAAHRPALYAEKLGVTEDAIVTPELAARLRGEYPDDFVLWLYHRNDTLTGFPGLPVDLVLSGHAHGGIVRLPFIGGLLDVHRRLGAEYEKGVYEEGSTVMIVSRGLGNSIVVPRFLNRPELVCVTLSIDSKTSD